MKSQVKSAFFGLAPGPTAAVTAPGRTKPTGKLKGLNSYYEIDIYGDATTYPDLSKPLTFESVEKLPWQTDPDWTETQNEWYVVRSGVQNGMQYQAVAAGVWSGYMLNAAGRCNPAQGITDDDFGALYDGVRIVCWDYWVAGTSRSHNWFIGHRPTQGTTDYGQVNFMIDNSGHPTGQVMNIYTADGNGNSNYTQAASPSNVNQDSCAWCMEFIPGSHAKVKLYGNVNVGLDFSGFAMPTATDWAFSSGEVASRDLTGAGYNLLEPVSLIHTQGNSTEDSTGRFGFLAIEYRASGKSFKYLK